MKHNEGNLRVSCEFYLEQNHVNKAGTEIDVMGIYGGEYKIVQFYYSGKGIAPASVYYGFYYSPQNKPITIMAVSGEKEEFENGYRIQDPGNEDWYYTEKITDNFYFYEAHY